MALSLSVNLANAEAVAAATNIGSGAVIEIRSGAKPATPETAASGTLLATITIVGSFTATNNTIAAADPASVMPVANGTAGHFRLKTSGGTAKIDGTITAVAGGGDLELSSTNIQTTVPVDIGIPQFTIPV